MPSRAFLTVAAATAATLGGGLASAGSAAAATAPRPVKVRPDVRPVARPAARPAMRVPEAAPSPQGVLGIDDPLEVGNNMCVTPQLLTVPLATDLLPTVHQACARRHGTDGGMHVLDDLCLAPVSLEGPPGSGPAPSGACSGGGATGPVSALRNFSVAGVRVTY